MATPKSNDASASGAVLAADEVADRFHFRKQPYRLDMLYDFLCGVLRHDVEPDLSVSLAETISPLDCVSVSAHGLLYVLACLCRTAEGIDPHAGLHLSVCEEQAGFCLQLAVKGAAGQTLLRDAPLMHTVQKVSRVGHFRFEACPEKADAAFRFLLFRYACAAFSMYAPVPQAAEGWIVSVLDKTQNGHLLTEAILPEA